jgi:DNA-binding transcriptional MerR regulator
VYTEEDVEWLTVCAILRGADMPLPELRRYIELVRAGDQTASERLTLLRAHRRGSTLVGLSSTGVRT